MPVPSPSPPDDGLHVQQKSGSLTPERTHTASERLSDDAPLQDTPTPNGTAQLHSLHDHTTGDAVPVFVAQNSADLAHVSTAGTEHLSVSSSPVAVNLTTPSTSPLAPPYSEPRERVDQKDKDGDKPGPSSTSPSPTQRSSPSPSHSQQKPPLPTARSNGTTPHQRAPSPPSKRSFWSKVIRAFIPCIFPSPHTHPTEALDTASISGSKEKEPSASAERVAPISAPSTTSVVKDVGPPASVTEESATLNPIEPTVPIFEAPPLEDEVPIQPTPPSAPHLLPLDETEGVTSGAVQAPGSTGGSPTLDSRRHSQESTPPSNVSAEDESEGTSFTEDEDIDGLDEEDDEDRLIMNGGAGIPIGPDGIPRPLLPPIAPQHVGRKCLILDLDETLVHSSFKSIQQADYVVPVEIEYHLHNVYVIKRPGVDKFLKKMGEIYEVVVFTASLSKYADPVLDKLDIHQVVSHRLFRESCYNHRGNYVKDLSQLGRPIGDTIILDNSPASYIFHPNNAVPVSSWFNDPHDTELTDLVPFLTDLATVDDVRGVLDGAR